MSHSVYQDNLSGFPRADGQESICPGVLLIDVATALLAVLPLCFIDVLNPSPAPCTPEQKPSMMTPLGLLVAGPTVDALGVPFWFALTGVLTLCASALGFLIPAVRQLEQRKVALLAVKDQV